jgi:hypothetical protein
VPRCWSGGAAVVPQAKIANEEKIAVLEILPDSGLAIHECSISAFEVNYDDLV